MSKELNIAELHNLAEVDMIIKGGKALPIGTKRVHGGVHVEKTAKGWVPENKGGSSKKEESQDEKNHRITLQAIEERHKNDSIKDAKALRDVVNKNLAYNKEKGNKYDIATIERRLKAYNEYISNREKKEAQKAGGAKKEVLQYQGLGGQWESLYKDSAGKFYTKGFWKEHDEISQKDAEMYAERSLNAKMKGSPNSKDIAGALGIPEDKLVHFKAKDPVKAKDPAAKSYSAKSGTGQPFLFKVAQAPTDAKGKAEYEKNGFHVSPQKGVNGLITSYFKDEATLKANTNKKYHKEMGISSGDNKAAAKPAKKSSFKSSDTYFETLSGTLDQVRAEAKKHGFEVDEQELNLQFGSGGVSYGTTKSATLPLLKDGKPVKSKSGKAMNRNIHVAIYRMDSGRYELTAYKTW